MAEQVCIANDRFHFCAKVAAFLRFLLVSLGLSVPSGLVWAENARVVIVDTVEHEASHQLAQHFRSTCRSCGPIDFLHMHGSLEEGKAIALELAEREKRRELSLVLTIGPPAVEMVSNALAETPIIYTYVGQNLLHLPNQNNLYGIPVDAPLPIQISILKAALPEVRSIGLIVSNQTSWNPHPFVRERLPKELRVYEIAGAKEMPEALRKASNENDAMIFIRDPSVINRDSVRFVIEYTVKKRVQSFTYSETLVDMGMGLALVPNPVAFAEKASLIAEQLLSGQEIQFTPLVASDYNLHINENIVREIQGAQTQDTTGTQVP